MRKLLVMMLAICALASCGKGPGSENIEITGGSANQEVFADNTQATGGVKFTTTGAWASTIVPTVKADEVWVSIDPASGDKAGEYTINILLEPNYTGKTREAEIKINCNGSTITITVEQKGTTQGGDIPELKPKKLVSKIIRNTRSNEISSQGIFVYDEAGRIKTITRGDNDYSYTAEYTHSGNKITEKIDDHQTIYTINSNGYITTIEESGESSLFTYDKNGCWTSARYKNGDTDQRVWENGNLKSTQPFLVSTPDGDHWGILHTFQYGTELNNGSGNIDITMFIEDSDYDIGILDYFGKRTKNLPIKRIDSQDKWEKDNGTTTFRYEKDAQGDVTKIYATYQRVGESVEPEYLRYEIQYK